MMSFRCGRNSVLRLWKSKWTRSLSGFRSELIDQSFLLCLIEINHHIAAKDDVVPLRKEFGLEIVEVKVDQVFERLQIGTYRSVFFALPHRNKSSHCGKR